MFHGLAQTSFSLVTGNSYSVHYYDDEEDVEPAVIPEDLPISSHSEIGILRYGFQQPFKYDGYQQPIPASIGDDTTTSWPFCLDGVWTGYRAYDYLDPEARIQPGEGLVIFTLSVDPSSHLIQGQAESHYGVSNVTGNCDDNRTVCLFSEYRQLPQGPFKINSSGTYDDSKNMVSGLWYYADSQDSGGDFCLRRTSPVNLQFLPSLVLTTPLERWSYALNAVLNQVRQRLWSWSFFKDRFDKRRHFVDLDFRKTLKRMRRVPQDVVSSQELDDIEYLQQHTLPCDGRFFMSIAENRVRQIIYHNKFVPSSLVLPY
jgi:hypothetical protein